jgi:hypothetical protein
MTNLVYAACDLFEFCPLNPRPTLQHLANASKFLGCGPEPCSLSHVHADPENFPHLPLVVENTLAQKIVTRSPLRSIFS